MLPTLPLEAAEKLFDRAAAAGVTREALLDDAGVDQTAGPLTYRALCRLYEAAAKLSGDPDFGLHVGERTSARMYGLLGYVTANSSTFGEALAHLGRFQRLWTEAVGVSVTRSGRALTLRYWHHGPIPAEARRQESEQMLAALLAFARDAVAGDVAPVEVRFEHRAPPNLSERRRIFGGRLRFSRSATELVLPSELLGQPIPHADPGLWSLINAQAEAALADRLRQEPFGDRVRGHIEAILLAGGEVSIGGLATALEMGPRTLQRRLRERGLGFRALVDEARLGMAKRLLLESSLSLAEVAFRAGYSQPSAFHRAFRRSTGTTPRDFRAARL